MFKDMREILGVSGPWPRPFSDKFLCARSALRRRSYVPFEASGSSSDWRICSIVCQKLYGSQDL